MPKMLIEIDTDTQVVVPRESFILVKNKLQDATVTPMCCMQPVVSPVILMLMFFLEFTKKKMVKDNG